MLNENLYRLQVRDRNRKRGVAAQIESESARHAPQQPQYEICQTCGGEGSLYDYTDDEVVECHVCKGTGKHRTVR